MLSNGCASWQLKGAFFFFFLPIRMSSKRSCWRWVGDPLSFISSWLLHLSSDQCIAAISASWIHIFTSEYIEMFGSEGNIYVRQGFDRKNSISEVILCVQLEQFWQNIFSCTIASCGLCGKNIFVSEKS